MERTKEAKEKVCSNTCISQLCHSIDKSYSSSSKVCVNLPAECHPLQLVKTVTEPSIGRRTVVKPSTLRSD